ncbi:MAG TPA: hypothetical protein VGL02_22290 [Streptomyces sp.]
MSETHHATAGKIGAHTKWAKCDDRTAATAPGRARFMKRFEREVDPDGVLPSDVRAQRAEHAKKAYFARLALKSAQARRKAKALLTEAEEAEAELLAAEEAGEAG